MPSRENKQTNKQRAFTNGETSFLSQNLLVAVVAFLVLQKGRGRRT